MLSCCFPSEKKSQNYSSSQKNLIHVHSTKPHVKPQTALDESLWHCPLTKHPSGEFSFAIVQANNLMEDSSQVESGPYGTFVGIYDGHGGPQCSQFINDNLHKNIHDAVTELGCVCEEAIKRGFSTTESEFVNLVRDLWIGKPQYAAVGSCCLVGMVNESALYTASLGDSRAVLGSYKKGNSVLTAIQLTQDHNANDETVRDELIEAHPREDDIVVFKNGVWRVKGIIQVTRSIGDVYLKHQEFQREPLYPRFLLSSPLVKPVLEYEPKVTTRLLRSTDRFVIFASDGLWEQLSNQEAVDIVNDHPRKGIAERLIKSALVVAAKKRGLAYNELEMLNHGKRRQIHDDISVVVLFFDGNLIAKGWKEGRMTSIKGGQDLSTLPDVINISDLDHDIDVDDI